MKALSAGARRFREFSGSFAVTRETERSSRHCALSWQLKLLLKNEAAAESETPLWEEGWQRPAGAETQLLFPAPRAG